MASSTVKPKLLVATPTADDKVCAAFHKSIVDLAIYAQSGSCSFEVDFHVIRAVEIAKVRNLFSAMMMNEASYTHLLFVDSDMKFRPELIQKLVNSEKDYIGGLCPSKRLNIAGLRQLAPNVPDEKAVQITQEFVCSDFVVRQKTDTGSSSIRMVNGLVQTRRLGAGILLLSRTVFQRVRDKYPDLWTSGDASYYCDRGVSGRIHQCFSPLQSSDGEYVSEDLSFCDRWIGTGGEVWANIDEYIGHVGQRVYEAAYIEKLKAGLF